MLSPEIAAKAAVLADTSEDVLECFTPLERAIIIALKQYMRPTMVPEAI